MISGMISPVLGRKVESMPALCPKSASQPDPSGTPDTNHEINTANSRRQYIRPAAISSQTKGTGEAAS
jgi:hypothetical protein